MAKEEEGVQDNNEPLPPRIGVPKSRFIKALQAIGESAIIAIVIFVVGWGLGRIATLLYGNNPPWEIEAINQTSGLFSFITFILLSARGIVEMWRATLNTEQE